MQNGLMLVRAAAGKPSTTAPDLMCASRTQMQTAKSSSRKAVSNLSCRFRRLNCTPAPGRARQCRQLIRSCHSDPFAIAPFPPFPPLPKTQASSSVVRLPVNTSNLALHSSDLVCLSVCVCVRARGRVRVCDALSEVTCSHIQASVGARPTRGRGGELFAEVSGEVRTTRCRVGAGPTGTRVARHARRATLLAARLIFGSPGSRQPLGLCAVALTAPARPRCGPAPQTAGRLRRGGLGSCAANSRTGTSQKPLLRTHSCTMRNGDSLQRSFLASGSTHSCWCLSVCVQSLLVSVSVWRDPYAVAHVRCIPGSGRRRAAWLLRFFAAGEPCS